MRGSKKPYGRKERMADLIQQELADLIRREVMDPRLKGVTVTWVDLAPDMSHAKLFISVLEGSADEAAKALNRAAGFFRSELAKRIRTRKMPQLNFVVETATPRGERLSALIDKAISEDRKHKE